MLTVRFMQKQKTCSDPEGPHVAQPANGRLQVIVVVVRWSCPLPPPPPLFDDNEEEEEEEEEEEDISPTFVPLRMSARRAVPGKSPAAVLLFLLFLFCFSTCDARAWPTPASLEAQRAPQRSMQASGYRTDSCAAVSFAHGQPFMAAWKLLRTA